MNSKYKIDEKTRYSLQKKELWHFNKLQQGWFTIIVFLTSLFELLIFTLGYFGSDFVFSDNIDTPIYTLLKNFQFECAVAKKSMWFIEKTPASMTLFKLHFIVIFMYTTLFMIVLFKIPYKYDRIEKTKKEKRADRKSRAKRRRKLKGLSQKNRAISNILEIDHQTLLMTADKA